MILLFPSDVAVSRICSEHPLTQVCITYEQRSAQIRPYVYGLLAVEVAVIMAILAMKWGFRTSIFMAWLFLSLLPLIAMLYLYIKEWGLTI